MSSILKALRRLEEDKAARQDAPVDIGRDILRRPRKARRSAPGLILALVVAGGLLTAGAAAILFHADGRPSVGGPDIVLPAEQAAASPQSTPQPPEVAEVAPPAPNRPLLANEPEVIEVRMASPPVASANRPPAPPRGPPAAAPEPPMPPAPLPSADPAPSAPVETAAAPQLVVSGIAYQPDPQGRLAVVNDLPVMQGTVIEGVSVEEILADRVVFSREGSRFEVTLGEVK
jgi:general secretion pathway protein B